MSGLVLKLGPKERVLINGAVVENGDRRNRLHILTPDVNILRLRDAIHPDEVTTPVRRVCYIAQLVLSGDVPLEEARPQLLRGIEHLSQVFRDPDSRAHLSAATAAVTGAQTYRALRSLRALLPREDRLLASAAGGSEYSGHGNCGTPSGTGSEETPIPASSVSASLGPAEIAAARSSPVSRNTTSVSPSCGFSPGPPDARLEP